MKAPRWIVLGMLLGAASPAMAGFEEGLAAYQRAEFATAARELADGAQKKDPRAMYLLADMYREGKGVDMDYSRAVALMKEAVALGFAPAALDLARAYGGGWGGLQQDPAEAVRLITFAAERGMAQAQYVLANVLLEGKQVPQDNAAGIAWLRRAAEAGHAEAQHLLYLQLFIGQRVQRDLPDAMTWLQRSAKAGHVPALVDLGLAYFNGHGVVKNETEAAKWLRAAADKGHPEALGRLGWMHYGGRGVPRDTGESVKLLRRAADAGDPFGQYYLGLVLLNDKSMLNAREGMEWLRKAAGAGYANAQGKLADYYFRGEHVAKDMCASCGWTRRAAEQEHLDGMFGLGVCYYDGIGGISKDLAQAARWFRKAAERGALSAQARLARMLGEGKGVARDRVEAVAWMHAAATGARGQEAGVGWLKERDELLSALPEADRSRALTRGDEYARKYSTPEALKR